MAVLRALCAIFVGLSLAIALAKPAVIVNLMVMSWGTLVGGVPRAVRLRALLAARHARGSVGRHRRGPRRRVRALPGVGRATACPLAGAIATLLPLVVLPAVSLLTRAPEASLVARARSARAASRSRGRARRGRGEDPARGMSFTRSAARSSRGRRVARACTRPTRGPRPCRRSSRRGTGSSRAPHRGRAARSRRSARPPRSAS